MAPRPPAPGALTPSLAACSGPETLRPPRAHHRPAAGCGNATGSSIGAVPQFPQRQKRAVSCCFAAARRGLSAVPLKDCLMQQNITSLRAMIKMHLQRSPWAVTKTQQDGLRSPAPCCFQRLKPLGSRGFVCGVFPLLPRPGQPLGAPKQLFPRRSDSRESERPPQHPRQRWHEPAPAVTPR